MNVLLHRYGLLQKLDYQTQHVSWMTESFSVRALAGYRPSCCTRVKLHACPWLPLPTCDEEIVPVMLVNLSDKQKNSRWAEGNFPSFCPCIILHSDSLTSTRRHLKAKRISEWKGDLKIFRKGECECSKSCTAPDVWASVRAPAPPGQTEAYIDTFRGSTSSHFWLTGFTMKSTWPYVFVCQNGSSLKKERES